DARLLISLMARDGLLHSPAPQQAVQAMKAAVTQLQDGGVTAGRIPRHLGSAQDLAALFTGPIGLTRILYLHADATDGERETARDEIRRHVETFTRMVFSNTD
ncbi:MAG: TetR/AcrR family transcriptional regulator, partial [Kibdelosporangium sp.]